MADTGIPPSGVYCIRNLISGRIYVGSSIKLRRRLQEHRRQLRDGVHIAKAMQRSWNKHGAAAFEFSVIEAVEPERLIEREQHWIDRLDAASRTKGFNASPTAGNCLGVKHSPETRARLSAAKKGIPKSPEHRAAIGAAHKGRALPKAQRAKIASTVRKHFAENEGARERMREVGRRNGRATLGRKMSDDVRRRQSEACRASERLKQIARNNLAKATPEQIAAGMAKRALGQIGRPMRCNRKLSFDAAQEIRAAKAAGSTYDQLTERFGLDRCSLHAIVKFKTYRNP